MKRLDCVVGIWILASMNRYGPVHGMSDCLDNGVITSKMERVLQLTKLYWRSGESAGAVRCHSLTMY